MTERNDNEEWDFEETEDSEEKEQDAITYQISSYPADYTLQGYVDKYDSDQLVIPEYQREYVWDKVQASKLIESFLLGLPVPGVFLYKERESNKLQVIDGQQRIMSVVRFFKNEFGEGNFRLKNINEKWNGNTFSDLEEPDRFGLQDTVLRATVVQQLDPQDDSSVYHIFERLNTGGVKLNPMEIRKCVYLSDYFELLVDLNQDANWRELIAKPQLDKRLRDLELVLRVLALKDHWKDYEKPMKGFLNNFLAKRKRIESNALAEEIAQSRYIFTNLCQYVRDMIGDKPFHLKGRLNYAVLDSVMVASIEAQKNSVTDLNERYERLKQDPEFLQGATISTSDESSIQARFTKAFEILAN